jgi:hypothetical protein
MNDDDILKAMKEEFRYCEGWEGVARKRLVEDVKFGMGDTYNMYQWPAPVQQNREVDNKPMLTFNKTQVHCLQIINDQRQNEVSIKFRPTGGGATQAASDIYEGIARHIEYQSNAKSAYDSAFWWAVFGGCGYWRVTTDYAHEDTFDQEIFIRTIANPLNVYLDPDIQEFDGSDANFGFVFSDMTRKEAEAKYPRHKDAFASDGMDGSDSWGDNEHVRVCEYFKRSQKPDTLVQTQMGTARKSAMPAGMYDQMKATGMIVQERPIMTPEIMWYNVIGSKIVDRKPWAGKYIPIVRVIGQETVIEGQLDRKGHVRALIDPQRMYNYQSSGSVEFVALQAKTPWLADAEAIEGNEEMWRTANVVNHSVLIYKGTRDNGEPLQKPERIMPPTAAGGHIEGMKIAQEEMMLVSGQYQAIMGAPSNETSGKAINARQRQGENATAHFDDHIATAIRYTGKIILDLIPHIYDTKRVMTILNMDGTQQQVQIDPNAHQAHSQVQDPDAADYDPKAIAAVLNPSIGRFDVMVDTGPSYATGKMEEFNALNTLVTQHPDTLPMIGDLWAASANFPGSEAIAKRFAKGLAPQFQTGGPSPQEQQMQQQMQQMAQEGQQQIEQLHTALQDAQKKLGDQAADLERKDYEAETGRLRAIGGFDPEALKPLIREMVSQVLGQPALPIMAEHAAAEQAMLPPPEPTQGAAPNA